MGNLGCLLGCRPAAGIVWLFTAAFWSILATQANASELLTAEFPALPKGGSCESALVPLPDAPILVTVVPAGSNPLQPQATSRQISLRVIGHDPVSRLGFLETGGNTSKPATRAWLTDSRSCVGNNLRVVTPAGTRNCKATGWIKQIGGKILPLALWQVHFDGSVPPPGTPLLDSHNRVAGLVFQKSPGSEQTGYAIPAEAVHRVRRDLCDGGVLIRGWLGLSLNASEPKPRVVRVLPGSPAAAAGIQPSDLLLQVGSRTTADYADVANAFFYLVPGQPTKLSVMRGSQRLNLTVTPVAPR